MMKSKVLVKLVVPVLEEEYDVYIPINKKIGNIIIILSKIIGEMATGYFTVDEYTSLFDGVTGDKYSMNSLVRETNIRNGSTIILM